MQLFKPLFKLFKLSESRISLNICWVKVLKNLEHLGKLNLDLEHLGKLVPDWC